MDPVAQVDPKEKGKHGTGRKIDRSTERDFSEKDGHRDINSGSSVSSEPGVASDRLDRLDLPEKAFAAGNAFMLFQPPCFDHWPTLVL